MPRSRTAARRLEHEHFMAQCEAQAMEERHRSVTAEPRLDNVLSTAITALCASPQSYTKVDGAAFTPLSKDQFSDGAQARACFAEWCRESLPSSHDASYVTVWVESMFSTMLHSTQLLPVSNVFSALVSTVLLMKTLRAVVPASAHGLVFALLDVVLSSVFDGWAPLPDESCHPTTRDEAKKSVLGYVGWCSSAYGKLVEEDGFAKYLTRARLWCEVAQQTEADLHQARVAHEEAAARHRREAAVKVECAFSACDKALLSLQGVVFRSWRAQTREQHIRKRTARYVIARLGS